MNHCRPLPHTGFLPVNNFLYLFLNGPVSVMSLELELVVSFVSSNASYLIDSLGSTLLLLFSTIFSGSSGIFTIRYLILKSFVLSATKHLLSGTLPLSCFSSYHTIWFDTLLEKSYTYIYINLLYLQSNRVYLSLIHTHLQRYI